VAEYAWFPEPGVPDAHGTSGPIHCPHGDRIPGAGVPEVGVKPRLRGVFHQYAFFASLASGTLLVLLAATTRAAVAAAVYAASVSALFGVSALYHRVTWTPLARAACAGSTTR
jgi:hypothetical protein